MIEGTVEQVLPDRHVLGWLRNTAATGPCHVQIRLGRSVVAESMADMFRADLLHRGHGHGHHGFRARLRQDLPAGPAMATLFVPDLGGGIPVRLSIPRLTPRAAARVEDLLWEMQGWTVTDLLAHPHCLALDAAMAAMGVARFIDAVFHFVLRRWPEAAEAAVYGQALQSLDLTPEGLLTELLASRERAELDPVLISPWHPEFPFLPCEPAA